MLTTREVIKTFYNALKQKLKNYRGNWDQNDPSATDYIKNRPFYTDGTKNKICVKERTFIFDSNGVIEQPNLGYFLIEGETYTVIWDGISYECVARNDGYDDIYIGNQEFASVLMGWNFPVTIVSNEPFFIATQANYNYRCIAAVEGTHKVSIVQPYVVKIDKKYLPEDNSEEVEAAIYDLYDYANWLEYNMANIPTDTVRYNNSQNLTEAQKTRARTNIGAVSSSEITGVVKYNEEQTLTEEQKNQARDNIGAVNDYNDLINAPLKRSIAPLAGEVIYWNGDTEGRPGVGTSRFSYYLVSKKDYSHLLYIDLKYFYSKIALWSNDRWSYTDLTSGSTNIYLYGENFKYWGDNGRFLIVYDSTDETHPNGLYLRYDFTSSKKYDYCSELHLPFIGVEGALNLTDTVISNETKSFKVTVDDSGTPTLINTADSMPIKIATEGAKDSIALIDQINGYTYLVCMRDGNLVTHLATRKIRVAKYPTKSSYFAGDIFEPEGMIIYADSYDGTTKEITNYTYSKEPLTDKTANITISYYEGGVTHIVNIPITVKPFIEALIDFEYTDNGDGTYTLTSWKGTYNGEPSTEMIIPNYSCIIV